MRHRVFLSHNGQDKDFVRKLAKDLREHGVSFWLDEVEMQVGDSLMERIQEGIKDARYFIVVLSPHSIDSPWVRKELGAAFALEIERDEKFILPALLKDCEEPVLLRDRVYADFRESYETGLLDLLKALVGTQRLREVCFVPPGKFVSSAPNGESTIHNGYYIDTHCVTTEDYFRFLEESTYRHPRYDLHNSPSSVAGVLPVNEVNLEDALAYCRWRSEVEGIVVRLPTADEWEKAARGTDGRRFPWGDAEELRNQYWFCNCLEFVELENRGIRERQPYNRFPKNVSPYGVRDMAGNVLEWTASDFRRPGTSPERKGIGQELRGGAFVLPLDFAACGVAVANVPEDRKEYIGFRCLSER